MIGSVLEFEFKVQDQRSQPPTPKSCYENILRQEPHNVQALHNLCVVYVERGVLKEAEQCLERASAMAPNERYITDHLEIVRQRRKLTTRTSALKDKTMPDPKDNR
ncbi:transmembrane and TPR repeat-containing protein CG4050 [Nephila pilipes]|uniref:Transmembrane and TPR repeat-containing protein CG4050 n=1 Tax=Nephila pilipes TaxID=299642 RepID=A0A8X6P8G0_NEPPI|nr:transmembrane and TPR repeat-containing protein CG4050 [Nephila pilipes]